MKVLSLFSGVGGFDLGLENAGMETVFQCEWDKHATKILERHWPDVPRWGDISTLTGRHILDHAPVIDVVAWGSPCQDLSVAGKRAGLKGERSGLFHEGIRIIKEIRELTNGKYPRISIWENVAGALSSGAGADFGQVLYEMDEAGACFSEWRLLDAQYFGVPQRRRRVFVVSVFDPATAERCPDPLLPVSQSVRWNPATGRTTRKTVAGTTQESFGNSGFQRWSETDTAITLSAKDHKSSNTMIVDNPILIDRAAFNQGTNAAYTPHISDDPVAPSLVARDPHAVFTKSRRAQTSTDGETWVEGEVNPTINQFDTGDIRATTAIVFENSYRDAARISDDGITNTLSAKMGTGDNNTPMVAVPIGFSHTQGLSAQPSESAWPTLRTEGAGMAVAIPIQDGREIEKNQNGLGIAESGAPAYTLDQTGAQSVAIGIQGNVIGRQDHNGPAGKGHTEEGDPMFTLNTTDRHAVIQYDGYNQRIYEDDVSVTIRIGRDSSDCIAQPIDAAGFKAGQGAQAGSIGYQEGMAQTLTSDMNGLEPTVLTPTMSVRRLTPLECERLMGWPDDWTAGQADTHRYKQCGNGVASPVAQWIGEQIINIPQ